MADIEPDLAEKIVKFIENIPITVQSEILLFVLMYGCDIGTMETDDFLPKLKEHLLLADGMRRVSAVIRVTAALDYVLWRSCRSIRKAEITMQRSSEKLSKDIIDRFLASHPMRQRHYDSVFSEWTQLRSTLLSPESIEAYEDNLLKPPFLKR